MLAISIFILASSTKSNLEEFINMLQTDKLLRQMLIPYNSSKYLKLIISRNQHLCKSLTLIFLLEVLLSYVLEG